MPVTRSTSGRSCAPVSRDQGEPSSTAEPSGTTGPAATQATATSETTATSATTATSETTATSATSATATATETEARHHKPSRQKQSLGSSKTKRDSKKLRLARANEEVIKLQLKLATARIATIEAEHEEDDDDSDAETTSSRQDTTRKVGDWLNDSQRHAALTDKPHVTAEEAPTLQPEERVVSPPLCPVPCELPPAHAVPVVTEPSNVNLKKEEFVDARAPQQIGLTELASAIALAAKAGSRPKFLTELPTFAGAHQEWLTFRAAYEESESAFTEAENLARLRRNIRGRAKEAVESLLLFNAKTQEIMKTLENRFGRPDCIALAEIDRMRTLNKVTDNARDVCVFASRVSNVVATLRALKKTHYLYNPEVTKLTIEKLTPALRYRWFDFAADSQEDEPDLVRLSRFLNREAERCSPYAPPETCNQEQSAAPRKPPTRTYAATAARSPPPDRQPTCALCATPGHDITSCDKFNSAATNERWDIAKEKRLCFACLRYRNRTHHCKRKKCDADGCKYSHHRLLHNDVKATEVQAETVASTRTRKNFTSYLKILPVHVSGPAGAVDTFALLDDGSTVTLVDADIARKTGASGPQEPLRIEAIGDNELTSAASQRVHLTLSGPSSQEFDVHARTIEDMNLSAQVIHTEDIEDCEHLRDIRSDIMYEQAEPRVLIGQDNWHLLLPTEVRVGRRDQPVASRTALGWVVHGASARTLTQRIHHVNFVRTEEESMDEQLRDYIALDSLLVNPKLPKNDPEQRALDQLNRDVVARNGTYEAPLLWKSDDVVMPDNYDNTLKRLLNIEKKLDRDACLKEKYNEHMSALVKKGYAEPAPAEKSAKKTWYLPHFAVVNAMKPGKLRIVHDAAARTKGVSLNDYLLKGPDLLQSLPGVLMRFRQRKIAVSADIREMFMQVKVKPEDRDALRYLWRGDRRDCLPPDEYRMTSLIFGATCSPATAIFVKDHNARRFQDTHPDAVNTIIRNHYVDDLLQSYDTETQAIENASDVDKIHRAAHYELRQWTSNSETVLDALSPGATQHNVGLANADNPTERVLGLEWRPKNDDLGFNLNLARLPPDILDKSRPTKRETLKILMSLFDPLGLASPVTIRAKQILQEIWRRGTEWDAPIDSDLAEQWSAWTQHLRRLGDIKIPRCYEMYSAAATLELHVFVDASESAYAAAAYWRATTSDGRVHITLVAAKTKVAPLKLTSIPRLELQAAVLGSRLGATVTAEHDIKPAQTTYWTDSKTVMTWLHTGARSYRAFVAHRIAAIEENTQLSDWRWLPTKHNVADDATRDVPPDFSTSHRWYRGPSFLYDAPSAWPSERPTLPESTGEEKVHAAIERRASVREAVPDPARFSSWQRLLRATARVLQFIKKCSERVKRNSDSVNYKRCARNKQKDPQWQSVNRKNQCKKTLKSDIVLDAPIPMDIQCMLDAEVLLVKVIQSDAYGAPPHDLDALRKGALRSLPLVIDNGLITINARVSEDINDMRRRPAVLSGDHHITRLYIDYVHRRYHHAGVETTVNECRTKYWVTRLRPTVRSVLSKCLPCRRLRNMPPTPSTGDLPPCRLAHHRPPFTYTGVDYFGPLTVTVGRGTQKRYGVLFTCLTTRAVHVEVAATLNTDSAVMALRRFIARRGRPSEIWSDNGTNLHGADNELRQALENATQYEATNKAISWRFIPPGAPFMGGAWERLVKSVKTALYTVLHERRPTEEVLTTLLAEVEFTVNNRPLTHVSVDPLDPEALTPNHFLLHGPTWNPAPGTFDDKDLIGRTHWRAAQRLADMYWGRWVKEYLPELRHRREPHGRGPPLNEGDVVLIADNTLPRNMWPMGRVVATYPGPDGVVRTADVRTKGGLLRRPTKKLVILPTS